MAPTVSNCFQLNQFELFFFGIFPDQLFFFALCQFRLFPTVSRLFPTVSDCFPTVSDCFRLFRVLSSDRYMLDYFCFYGFLRFSDFWGTLMGPCPFPIVSQFVQIISICRQSVLSWPQPSGLWLYKHVCFRIFLATTKTTFTVKIVQHSVQHKRALISLEPENPNKPQKTQPSWNLTVRKQCV